MTSQPESSGTSALMSYASLYRRAALAVLGCSFAIAVVGTGLAWALAGGEGLRGGVIGGGTVVLLGAVGAGILLIPGDRRPLLAGLAPMASFVLKLAGVAGVVLGFAHREGFSHGAAFGVIVVGVLATMIVESVALSSRRVPVVEPSSSASGHPGTDVPER